MLVVFFSAIISLSESLKIRESRKNSIPNYLYSKSIFAFNNLVGFSQQGLLKGISEFLREKHSDFFW